MATNVREVAQNLSRYPWALWRKQMQRIVSIDTKRNMLSRRAGWAYFLAFAPSLVILFHLLRDTHPAFALSSDTEVLAGIIQMYYVRLGIFFGCLGIFSRLIRGEMVERSLHFSLLLPVRREVFLLAKFVSGALGAIALFASAVLLDFTLIYLGFGAAGREYVFNGPGLSQLGAYLWITVLACLGYGSVFLLLSMIFRNPTPVAMLVMGWEAINPIFPAALQKLSIASYLRHMMPVHISADGIFALLTIQTEPVPGWLATLGVLAIVAAILAYSCHRMRLLEIRYMSE